MGQDHPRDPDSTPTLGPGRSDHVKTPKGRRHGGKDEPAMTPGDDQETILSHAPQKRKSQHRSDPQEAETLPGMKPPGESQSGPKKRSRAGKAKTLGPYRILEEIGRGGMGVVYKAFHPGLKRTVALKVLLAGEDASEEAIVRFHREAEAVAKLGHHPNIVPVYDIGNEGRLHFFAMHYVEGKSLDRMIDDGDLTPRKAAIVALKIGEGLRHAHKMGVLHRDIKPANILVTKEGHPQITDFGLAKDVDSKTAMTRSGSTLGTPQYMPPEQADGRLKDIDERTDVYSVGATLYEMLCFQPPFEGESVVNVIRKVLFDEPAGPRKLNPVLDKDLETICLKCLEKDPADRYQTAGKLTSDIKNYLKGHAIQARPIGSLEKTMRLVRRRKGVSFAVGASSFLFLVSLLVLGATLLFGGGDPIGEAKAEYENEFAAIEKIADEGDYNQALERIRELDKKIASTIKTEGREAKTRLSKLDGRVDAAIKLYDTQTIIDSYKKRFTAAEGLEDPKNREEQIRTLISELETLNRKKKSTEIGNLASKKQTALEDAVESRLEAEIKGDYSRAQEFEQQGLLVEAFYEYEKVTSEWEQRETDLQKKKVGAVYTANESKPEEIARRIWHLEGKDPVWRTLQFCVEEAKKRGDYRSVTDDEYHTIAVLLAKKVVEPLAQGSTDRIPVAVQRDGTWWKERMENLEWESRRAPGDFVASLWECYQMFKGTDEEQKWLGYARKWMEIFKRINEDNIDAYIGKALLDNHFVAMEIDPDPARREEYKQEIRRLCDLIVKKKWNEELGFLMHYIRDGDEIDERNILYSYVAQDVLALYCAHSIFRNEEYRIKANQTLEMLLNFNKASKNPNSAQIFYSSEFKEKNIKTDMGSRFRLGSIEMYILYSMVIQKIGDICSNQKSTLLANKIYNWVFDNVRLDENPYFGIYSYTIPETEIQEPAKSFRDYGKQKAHRILAELVCFAQSFKQENERKKEMSQARYTLINNINLNKTWLGISNMDTSNTIEDGKNNRIVALINRGLSPKVDPFNTTFIYNISSYFRALRKK